MDEIWFSGQRKIIRWKMVKAFLMGGLIFFLIGTGWGMYWRYLQTHDENEARISKLQGQIDHYRKAWTPIREKVEVKSKQGARGWEKPRGAK